MPKGKVVLVGAGPGDPGLLTIKGRELLAAADVVVYDRLGCDEVLQYAARAAKIYVGKEKDHHPVPQGQINEILLRQAAENALVVRLKGGDPYVFGRGGEEAEFLLGRGVPVEVVPGVTSALAALSYAGIPATHRDMASSVHIITGHAKQNGALAIDYAALRRAGGTLVFLMAVSTLQTIAGGLLEAGMPAATPAAVVENGTLPRQRRVGAPLGEIAAAAKREGVQSPAILVVGGVCALGGVLGWFERLPLFGKTIVVTRPENRQGTLCGKLARLGADVLPMPCIKTETDEYLPGVCDAIARLPGFSWLALTSPQGVQSLFAALDSQGRDVRLLAPVKIAAIGAGTAAELALRGLKADYVPAQYDAAHLAEGLAGRVRPGERVLMLRAEKGTPELPRRLQSHAVAYEDVPAYGTSAVCGDTAGVGAALAQGGGLYVTFTSASTVRGFAACLPGAPCGNFTAVCIGEATEAAAKEQGYTTIRAQNATVDDLITAIQEDAAHA